MSRKYAIALVFSLCAVIVSGAGCSGGSRRNRVPHRLAPGTLAIPETRAEIGLPESKFEKGFLGQLQEAEPGRLLPALVDLSRQVDLFALTDEFARLQLSRSERRSGTVRALESVAQEQQAALQPLLDKLQADGSLGYVRSVAIVNRLVLEARPAALTRLAASDEVARILPDWRSDRRGGRRPPDVPGTVRRPGDRFRSWALDAMGVPELWAKGLDGTGVTVGMIDTGVYGQHEQFRGREAGPGRGWYDPVEARDEPYDSHGHGTTVLSQAVGGNPDGRVLGVAPGARWSVALANWKNHYSRVRMTLAADWMLREARPDVLLNAWSHDEGPCTDFDLPFINAWRAAGIFVVFPAGNSGPEERSGEAPAQLTGTVPAGGPVVAVSGLDPDLRIHRGSSRGPSLCGGHAFPLLAAPGADLPFAFPPGPDNYGIGEGTSLSVGLLGGAAALLLQARPDLLPWELEDLLTRTARDLPPVGWDPATGAGLPDLPAALDAALSGGAEAAGEPGP